VSEVNTGLPIPIITVLLTITGCSVRSAPPMALHADTSYPRPSNEQCGGEQAFGSLRVEVADQLNTPLPQVPVYLVPVGYAKVPGGSPPNPAAASTDANGMAMFQGLVGESRYTVLAAMNGFVPEIRAIQLGAGCSGSIRVVLRVSLRDRLDALNAGRPIE
jgi:hypothetical protein